MLNNEYITIKDFAKRANVSQQAIYKQLDNKLKNYLKEINNKNEN